MGYYYLVHICNGQAYSRSLIPHTDDHNVFAESALSIYLSILITMHKKVSKK